MKIFSLPLNPKLNPSQFNDYLGFVNQYKDWIYDIYFTSRIAPFNQDAMGDVFVLHEEAAVNCIEAALHIQNTLGVTVSATFNNIHVKPDQKNLDLFIKNFRPLYDAGIRSATIPHTSWVLTGKLQAEFPELYIKNTILRDVNRANQVYELAKAGFNYVNLDRDLMRDQDELAKIKRVKSTYPHLKISLLANEGCAGNCSIMPEHYQYNCTRTAGDPQYFTSSISRISCERWDQIDPAINLKTANLPPWRDDWVELLSQGVDTFKLHGRENIDKLSESMRIIMRYAANESILFDNFEEFTRLNNLAGKPIDAWRKLIKNCKFDCWDCHFCDRIYQRTSNINQHPKVINLVDAIAFHDNYDIEPTTIAGLTSDRVRKLLQEIGLMSNSYLEVGCYHGSTATAVLDSNVKQAYFVDHWQQHIQPANGESMPQNDKAIFVNNLKAHKKSTDIKLFDGDLFQVDTDAIKGVDFFFYDGPHDAATTSQAVQYYSNSLADTAIIVFDDANWEGVVSGAQHGIQQAGLHLLYEKILLNEQESSEQWWNGLYITVVTKQNKVV